MTEAKIYSDERMKATFNSSDMTSIVYGSQEMANYCLEGFKHLEKIEEFRIDPDLENRSRVDKLHHAAHGLALQQTQLPEKYNFNYPEAVFFSYVSFPFSTPTGVHQVMFIPTLKYLGSDDQGAKWLPRIYSYEIIGCYAQTELGHGSDVQNLETTATFEPESDSFIINSPTLTSGKWWVGELGIHANHAMVFAQLILSGKKYGVHPFIVPIRDLKTHKPLTGIKVGDIGPKVGFDTKDNGFIYFDKVRIPRENMMMRYAKVTKSGEFKKPDNAKMGFSIMLKTRLAIVTWFPRSLGMALTIAIKYSLIRKQFTDVKGVEQQIIDYQTQQQKLFTPLAELYAILISGYKIKQMMDENMDNIVKKQDYSKLQEMHIILSGTKANYTEQVLYWLEICRMACGGHGYSYYSGIPGIIDEFKPMVTLEGENTVMYLQVSRFLVKCLDKAMKGQQLPATVQYLTQTQECLSLKCPANNYEDLKDFTLLRQILTVSACSFISNAAAKIMQGMQKGRKLKQVWDEDAGVDLVEAARAHIVLFTFNSFAKFIETCNIPTVKPALTRLCQLYALTKIIEKPIGVLESEYMNGQHFLMLRQLNDELLKQIRIDAFSLIDAFQFPDVMLRSALAMKDGKVYETIFDWASTKNSMNKNQIPNGHEYIKKIREIPKL